MIINHNMASLNTYRQMSTNTANTSKSLEKLSSGLRINKAGDDAAGLAISEKMRGQIRGLDQAQRNSQDGISMIQTAEGSLSETHSILQRMKELATQAANDTNVGVDRTEIQKEINQLTSEVNRIGNTTEFNTQKLLDGTKTKTADTAAVMTGAAVTGNVTMSSTATAAVATGVSVPTIPLTIHSGLGAKAVSTAGRDLDTASVAGADLVVANGTNEMTMTVGGVQKTFALAAKTYDGTVGSLDTAQLLIDINAAINTAYTGQVATASIDSATNKMIITSATVGAGSQISIDGGGLADSLFGALGTIDNRAGVAANNSFDIKLNGGGAVTVTVADGTYGSANALAAAVETAVDSSAITAGVINVTNNAGSLKFETVATGTGKSLEIIAGGSANAALGLNTVTATNGNSASNSFTMEIDNEVINVTMEEQTFTDKAAFAGALQAKINQATISAADATVSFNASTNKFTITSGKTGATSEVKLEAANTGFAAATGMTAGNDVFGAIGAGAQINFQIGANQGQGMVIQISDMRSQALKVSSTGTGDAAVATGVSGAFFVAGQDVTNGTNNTGTEYALDVSTFEKASAAVKVFDNAIQSVSAERSKLGAYTNRLEHTITNLGTSSENLTAAESRIRDVDMAKEMMQFQKNNILSQAAQAMMAQANQQPQGVLQLLR